MTNQKNHVKNKESATKESPENKIGGHTASEWKAIDKEYEDNIYRMVDNIKGCLAVLLAVAFLFFCFSQCESTEGETKEQKTEILKSSN